MLHALDLGIQKFSQKDLTTLSNISQLQVNSIWTAVIAGLIILFLGFVFLVRLILTPIAIVTQALAEKTIDIFNKNQISASEFIMEVTESIVMTNPQQSI